MINRRNLREGYISYAGSHILIYLINGLYRAEAYRADDSRLAGQDSRYSVLNTWACTIRTASLQIIYLHYIYYKSIQPSTSGSPMHSVPSISSEHNFLLYFISLMPATGFGHLTLSDFLQQL